MSFDAFPFENSLLDDFHSVVKIEQFPHLFSEDDKCNTHFQSPSKKLKKSFSTKERVKKPVSQGRLIGHWNITEKKRYHWFLEMYHSHFQNKHMRRMDKIFKSMADFIGSRAADQCRSHHQKMQKKFNAFHNIIYHLRLSNYNSIETEKMEEELKGNEIMIPDDLIDSSLFYLHQVTTKEDVEEQRDSRAGNGKGTRMEKEEWVIKLENIEYQSEEEGNYQKGLFLDEINNQPLI